MQSHNAFADLNYFFVPRSQPGSAGQGKVICRAQQAGLELSDQVICGNDRTEAWCTYRQEAQYHSHRRDALLKGGAGRMAAYIWITA
jgi:copper oxidase (laccase) domain-containing protein